MGLVRIISLYLITILSVVLLSCASINTIGGGYESNDAGIVYNLTTNVFKRILILYPELDSVIIAISDDILDNIDIPNSGSYISPCFHELSTCLALVLDKEEMTRVEVFADKLSKYIKIQDDGTISDSDKVDLRSFCKGIESSVTYIRKWEEYDGYIPRGYKI